MGIPCSLQVGMSFHPIVAVTLGPAGRRVLLNTQSGVPWPPFHCPTFSAGLLVFESMCEPASCTAASPPDLKGTYITLIPTAFWKMLVRIWSVSLDWLPPILISPGRFLASAM